MATRNAKSAPVTGTNITPEKGAESSFLEVGSAKTGANPEITRLLRNVVLPLGIGVLFLGGFLYAASTIYQKYHAPEKDNVPGISLRTGE